ncbi:MAG TPA: TatD family hydrolase [Armatimonadota bacterium]|nr:TatD family hydrolase [Armatimonadota bacterium]
MSAGVGLTDTHAHLTHPDLWHSRLGCAPGITGEGACATSAPIARAAAAGVGRIITVGFDLATSASGARLAATDERVWHAPGIHPHDASCVGPEALAELRRLATLPRAVAIGETGLDFYRDRSPRDAQAAAFRAHLALAAELDLPVIVHSRDAHQEVLAIWAEGERRRGVLHCFSGDADIARRAVEIGLYIGIAGPVTFRSAERLRAIVRGLPRERVLLETDCPYLAPHPHRGEPNEPAYLPLIAAAVAQCWGVTAAEVAQITTANAAACFPELAG